MSVVNFRVDDLNSMKSRIQGAHFSLNPSWWHSLHKLCLTLLEWSVSQINQNITEIKLLHKNRNYHLSKHIAGSMLPSISLEATKLN